MEVGFIVGAHISGGGGAEEANVPVSYAGDFTMQTYVGSSSHPEEKAKQLYYN